MLEKYIENFDPDAVISEVQKEHGCTRKQAIKILEKKIKKEPYYQGKIREAIEARYPDAYVRKIAQGIYSEGGIADLMVVLRGRYIALEVKRPVLGEPSKLQIENQRQVRMAGGVYEFVIWPEEAIAVIEAALRNKQKEK